MDKRLRLGDWLKPALFTLLALVPLLIWLGFLFQRGGMQAVGEVLWTNSVGRFSGSFVEAGHYEPFYYYLAKLPEAFLPWNILVYLACGTSAKAWCATATGCFSVCGWWRSSPC